MPNFFCESHTRTFPFAKMPPLFQNNSRGGRSESRRTIAANHRRAPRPRNLPRPREEGIREEVHRRRCPALLRKSRARRDVARNSPQHATQQGGDPEHPPPSRKSPRFPRHHEEEVTDRPKPRGLSS